MSLEIDKIFSATAQSPWHFLNTSGQGCYIPAYQRPYSWDEANVERLLEDALHGLGQLRSRSSTISFLGTIIAIHDTKYRTVKPIFRPHVPPRVMTIIDGQQRICTFLMANVAFHELLRQHARSLERRKEEEAFAWLLDQCQTLMADLQRTFQLDVTTGDDLHRYYPRITRAYDDSWSKRLGEAHYNSPIARLIWEYIQHFYSNAAKTFRYYPRDEGGSVLEAYRPVADIFGHLQRKLSRVSGKQGAGGEFPSLLEIARKSCFCEGIWGYELPESVVSFIAERSDDRGYGEFEEALRIVILAKYMNHRMAFTIVTTESEDDAFDMFEALNTTGEPLTAFETFKPRVIEEEKLDKYETSPSRRCLLQVDEYLDMFPKAEARQKATSELLVPFALAETGEKLPKRLNDQRRYLRNGLEDLKDLDDKRDFVQSLANLALFMRTAWEADRPDFAPITIKDEEALVCFQGLRDLKHNITIAPLARFHDAARRADDDSRGARAADLAGAIRTTTAFSMLWRAAKGGTGDIDGRYREVMRAGVLERIDGEVVKVPPLAKRPKDDTGVVSLANYRRSLRAILVKEFPTKEEWIRAAVRTPIFSRSRDIARFVLLCAGHDAVVDPDEPGLVKRGREGVAPMLTLDVWNNPNYLTVEHVAPQNPGENWEDAISDDPELVHRLGNLTLLPRVENSIVGNRSWPHKRLFYRMLSAETDEAQAKVKAEAAGVGLVLGAKVDRAVTQAKHLGLCTSLAAVTGGWDVALIDKRSRRIADLAWQKLAPWLDLPS